MPMTSALAHPANGGGLCKYGLGGLNFFACGLAGRDWIQGIPCTSPDIGGVASAQATARPTRRACTNGLMCVLDAGQPVGKGWLSILRSTEKWRRWRLLFQEVQGLSTGTCPMYTTLTAMISFTLACKYMYPRHPFTAVGGSEHTVQFCIVALTDGLVKQHNCHAA